VQQSWDPRLYEESFGIITRLGVGLLDLLAPQEGEHILDLGCGIGDLAAQIASSGAHVIGIDSSEAMIRRARELHPSVHFEVGRAEALSSATPLDAVFSNAALHWMMPPEAVAGSVFRALRPGGRFVAEMGGRGNIAAIMGAASQALAEQGIAPEQVRNPWYFPSIGQYASLLEPWASRSPRCSSSTAQRRWRTAQMGLRIG